MGKRLTLVLTLVLAVAMIGTALTYAGARGFRSGGPRQGRGDGPFANLTEDQRSAVQAKVTEMKDSGATREEIRAARREMLEGYGIEVPETWGQRSRRGDGPFANLTEDQRAAIREKVETLKAEGASPEGIRAEVRKMLEGFGVELPEDWGQRPRRGDGPFSNLTEEQRDAIREKVKELRGAGVPREEIRTAIAEMLEGYGIERPENPDTETEEVSKTVVSQNIPNPFNPITTIAYDLSKPSNVTLRVYAVTGQKVATLVSDYQQPGHHEVAWDGSGFANGVYVYRFEAGPFTETKRMLLLK